MVIGDHDSVTGGAIWTSVKVNIISYHLFTQKSDLVCSIDWNFIGKMETLNQDTEWVIEDMGVKGLAEYPKRNKTTK